VSKKLIIIIAGVALPVLGVGGYFGYTMFLAGGKAASPVAAQKLALKKERTAMKLRIKQRIDGPIVTLGDDFVVNLGGLAHFAKFNVSLKVDKQTMLAPAATSSTTGDPVLDDQAQIRDIVIADTSSYSAAQLASISGKTKLKERIMTDVANKTNTVALDVYFTGFAIQ
jgi:flagellar basal body-associated protein FliL